jgi:peptide chain release factor 2
VEFVDDVEFRSTLNHPEDELSCILEINAGAGGTESCDWAEMLLRMYIMWGEKNGYKVPSSIDKTGMWPGIKSAEIEINGEYAYGMLKGRMACIAW